MKKIFENTFSGTYKDTGDNTFEPTIFSENNVQTANLSSRISTELTSFEGKKVRLKIIIEVEEIG